MVLPCSWFDPEWVNKQYDFKYFMTDSDTNYDFDNFSNGSFTCHWHNKWNVPIGIRSPLRQLSNLLML